jgi:RNA-directed DNA polymerase
MEERMMQIRQLNHGWGNYFKLSEAKSVFGSLDEWARSRIRLCYWKQRRKVKTRIGQLEKLGIKSSKAYQWSNTRKGYWRTVHSPILTRALNNAFLKKAGFVSLKDITTPLKTVNV